MFSSHIVEEKIYLVAVSLHVGVFAGAGRTAVKSALGESKALLEKVGESRELVGLAEVGERAEVVSAGVEEGKKVELFAPHGESSSKLGGECDGTGVVPLPGD